MDDFWEFFNYVEDEAYLPIPRQILRDNLNPLEVYTDIELLQRVRFSRYVITTIILPMVYPNIIGDNRGLPIPPLIKLYVALQFYASGCYQRVGGDIVSISQSSACRISSEVSERLARNLPRYVKFPQNRNEFQHIKRLFFEIAGFPGLIGCVDGTHVEIKSPGGPNAELYRNRKGWMSLNVQVVAGPHCEIMDIVVRWPGSAHDNRIFNSSSVRVRLERGDFPGIVLGDSAYAQIRYVYTPLLVPANRTEQLYNNAHIHTRNVVERTFGIWKGKFNCLASALQLELRNATRVIADAAVLHNIAINQGQQFPNEDFIVDNNAPDVVHPVNVRGNAIRAAFIQRHFAGR